MGKKKSLRPGAGLPFRCVICTSTVEASGRTDEHVFPEAIGGTLVYRELCKRCNDELGSSADVALTDHFAIQGFRKKFRLAGKTGKVPVPFSRGGVLVERGVRTPFTWDGEYMHRRPTERVTAHGRELLVDPRDAKDIPKIEASLRTRGRSDTVVRIADETMRGVITLPYNRETRSCEPCLVKIIYELACGLLGPTFLDEPFAERMRAFIRNPGADIDAGGIEGVFRTGQSLMEMKGAREELLLGGLIRHRGNVMGYARIFNFLDATIHLSDRAHPQVTEKGLAVSIDVTRRDQEPVFCTFASLGWMGLPATA
jgi:hypothetical protein